MTVFRLILISLWLLLAVYTGFVVSQHGLGLLPIFFGDIAEMSWPGQFNLDFLCFLVLSALWTAWRNSFSAVGLLLAVLALFGGAGFLLPYLLVLSLRAGGDIQAVVLGSSQTRT
jgi:hypothetical protein